jgi:hypothetical protein
MLEHFVLDVMH